MHLLLLGLELVNQLLLLLEILALWLSTWLTLRLAAEWLILRWKQGVLIFLLGEGPAQVRQPILMAVFMSVGLPVIVTVGVVMHGDHVTVTSSGWVQVQ